MGYDPNGKLVFLVITKAIFDIIKIITRDIPTKEEHYSRNDDLQKKYFEEYGHEMPTCLNDIINNPTLSANWKNDIANAHQFTVENFGENVKYLSLDGKYELIFDKNGQIVTDPRDIGTYNFGTNTYDHLIMDVLPWVFWGNSAIDTTTPIDRVWYLIGGPKIFGK